LLREHQVEGGADTARHEPDTKEEGRYMLGRTGMQPGTGRVRRVAVETRVRKGRTRKRRKHEKKKKREGGGEERRNREKGGKRGKGKGGETRKKKKKVGREGGREVGPHGSGNVDDGLAKSNQDGSHRQVLDIGVTGPAGGAAREDRRPGLLAAPTQFPA